MDRVIVPTAVSRALRALGRTGLLAALNSMHSELEDNADVHRGNRHPDDPDLFVLEVDVPDNGGSRLIAYLVDDRQALDGILTLTDVVDLS